MVNQLPQGWKEVKLKDICVLINGRAFKQNEFLDSGKYKVLRVGNFFSNNKWYYSDLELDNDKYCEQGDLLFAWSASFGPKIWNDKKTIYHYHIWKVKVNEFVEKNFLYYLLLADSQKIKKSGHGVAMIHITKMDMENRLYIIPTDKSEQKYIVDTLDAVAEMIKLRKETIQLAKDLIPAIFHEMFGDPNIENKNYVPFNQFFVVVNNEKKEIKSEDYRTKADGLLPVVDQGQKEIVAYTEQLDKKISAYNNPIILFGDHTREVKFIDFDFVVGADGTQLMRTVDGVEPLFAFWQLKMKHIESRGYSRHFKYVKAMQFLKPDIVKQEEFADKVEQINMYIAAQQEELEQFETLFQSLLHEAFTGVLTWNYPRKECHDKKDK